MWWDLEFWDSRNNKDYGSETESKDQQQQKMRKNDGGQGKDRKFKKRNYQDLDGRCIEWCLEELLWSTTFLLLLFLSLLQCVRQHLLESWKTKHRRIGINKFSPSIASPPLELSLFSVLLGLRDWDWRATWVKLRTVFWRLIKCFHHSFFQLTTNLLAVTMCSFGTANSATSTIISRFSEYSSVEKNCWIHPNLQKKRNIHIGIAPGVLFGKKFT